MVKVKWHLPMSTFFVFAFLHGVHVQPQKSPCLGFNLTREPRFLVYPDQSLHPVLIPAPDWTSAQFDAEVAHILLSEVMEYAAVVVPVNSIYSDIVVSGVAGCSYDCQCRVRNDSRPQFHFSLESWVDGAQMAACLPADVAPILLNVLGYPGDDTYYLFQDVVDAGWTSSMHLSLDNYQSYDATFFKPHVFFDSWEKMMELLPPDVVMPCPVGMDPGNYVNVTGDSNLTCGHNDTVWFSPACRFNTTECVPLLMRYTMIRGLQLSYFLNLPLAIVMVGIGNNNYAEYYQAIRGGKFLFSYFQPDDSIFDSLGRPPVMLNLPRANQLEQLRIIYKTGSASQSLVNYGWRELPQVDPRVFFFASNINFFAQDINSLMNQTRHFKDSGLDGPSAAREAACTWVKGNQDRWQSWIPAYCPKGQSVGKTPVSCVPCEAGTFCEGGFEPAVVCPAGFYCPANTAQPIQCPPGRTTATPGSFVAASCCECLSGYFWIPSSGSCVSFEISLPSIIVPVTVVLAALLSLLAWFRIAQEEALWRIKEAEIVCTCPYEVLGRGAQGVIIKAFLRGTPVAVKHLFGKDDESYWLFSKRGPSVPELNENNSNPEAKDLKMLSNLRSRREILTHVKLLTAVRHPCITTVMGVALLSLGSRRAVCLVMELMELGSLWDLLRNPMFRFDGELALRTLQSVAQGVRFLHEATPPIIHGDLKSGNILMDKNFHAKISDISIRNHAKDKIVSGTTFWMAPECLLCKQGNTVKSDVYSFGVVLWECLTRKCPYEDATLDEVMQAVRKGERRLRVPAGCSVEVAALWNDCCSFDPDKRPLCAEIERRFSALDASLVTSPALSRGRDGFDPNAARPQWSAPQRRGRRQSISDTIMHNLFPDHVARALLRGEKVPPDSKEMITMYFSDIANFASLSSAMSAEKVGDMLDRLYGRLDELADRLGVYTIETIGGTYLCATNVVAAQPEDHAALLARFSVAAVRAAADVPIDEEDPSLGGVQIRVGLNSGPCMASVVGKNNPKYTLFGDTINVASRMQSTSLPGRVQCSAATAALIRAQGPGIRLEPRGKVEVKGKGVIETYWIPVDSPPRLCDEPFTAAGVTVA